MKERISPAAFALIVRFESGDRAYYDRFLTHPTWPGGRSGVTIGFGYDLGYEKDLDSDWAPFLGEGQISRLARCLGKIGSIAKQSLSGVRDIVVPWEAASEVFNEKNLPREIRKTLSTFPGAAEKLPADAFGALVSLIFNRGTDLNGDRRREMLAIRQIIANALPREAETTCRKIAAQIREMKRLWPNNPESDGDLYDRREAEARLVEKSA